MKKFLPVLVFSLLLVGCVNSPKEGEATPQIPKNCVSWFDGCNRCFIENGEIGGCTKMFCKIPQEPKCLKFSE